MNLSNPLNKAQLNYLWSTLYTFEASLRRARAALHRSFYGEEATNPSLDITPLQLERVIQQIDSTLAKLDPLSTSLGIVKNVWNNSPGGSQDNVNPLREQIETNVLILMVGLFITKNGLR